MEKINKIRLLVLAFVLGVVVTGCSDVKNDDDDPGYGGRKVALVTYQGTENVQYGDDMGYVSLFTYFGEDGIESQCRSTFETRLPQTLTKGQRMVIAYSNTTETYPAYPQGPVNVMSYVLVPTVYVQSATHDEAVANDSELNLFYENGKVSMYRTGYYINLDIYMPNYSDRQFTLLVDENTVDTETPDLYLSTEAKGVGQGYVSKTLVSLDITEVWRNPVVRGVNLHVNNTAGNEQKVFRLSK